MVAAADGDVAEGEACCWGWEGDGCWGDLLVDELCMGVGVKAYLLA